MNDSSKRVLGGIVLLAGILVCSLALSDCTSTASQTMAQASDMTGAISRIASQGTTDFRITVIASQVPKRTNELGYIGLNGIPPGDRAILAIFGQYNFSSGTGLAITEALQRPGGRQSGATLTNTQVDEYLLFPNSEFRKEGTLSASEGKRVNDQDLQSTVPDPNAKWIEFPYDTPEPSANSPRTAGPGGSLVPLEAALINPGFLISLASRVPSPLTKVSIAPTAYRSYFAGAGPQPEPTRLSAKYRDSLFKSGWVRTGRFSLRQFERGKAASRNQTGVAQGLPNETVATFSNLFAGFAEIAKYSSVRMWLEREPGGSANSIQADIGHPSGIHSANPISRYGGISVWMTINKSTQQVPIGAPPPDEVTTF